MLLSLLLFASGVSEPHNIIILLIDDLGIDQLSAYDNENYYTNAYPYAYTPVIDSLASDGVRFNQCRANPICSPSRASLQTGRYGARTGCTTLVHGPTQGVSSSYELLGFQSLAQVVPGYDTGMFGKLHLSLEEIDGGTGDDYARSVLGYDTFRGIIRNPITAPFPLSGCTQSQRDVAFTNYFWVEDGIRSAVTGTGADPCEGTYLTFKQRLRTQNWINLDATEPFMAIWNTSDIHGPFQWAPKGGSRNNHGFSEDAPEVAGGDTYYNTRGRAKLEYLDGAIGRLLDSIDAGVLERTTVIVIGDNGTPGSFANVPADEPRYPIGHPLYQPGDEITGFSMSPYQASHMKGSAYEQGSRVPLIVSGKAVRHPGRESNALVDITDIFETVRQLTNRHYTAPLPRETDSISFVDILRDFPDAQHPRKFSHSMLRKPNGFGPITLEKSSYQRYNVFKWTIVRHLVNGVYHDEFYELISDPLQEVDLGVSHPEYAATAAEWEEL